MNNDRTEIQTQSAWLHAASPGVWTCLKDSWAILPLFKLLLICKASFVEFLAWTRLMWVQKSDIATAQHIFKSVSSWDEPHSQTWDSINRGLGQVRWSNPQAESTGRNFYVTLLTQHPFLRDFCGIRVGWEEVKTSGFAYMLSSCILQGLSFWKARWNFKR